MLMLHSRIHTSPWLFLPELLDERPSDPQAWRPQPQASDSGGGRVFKVVG